MEQLLAKMQEYIKMDTEIAYEEFVQYQKNVMDMLQKDFEGMEQETLVALAGICQILFLNGEERGNRKTEVNQKKFRKMAAKSRFWFDAISLRLQTKFHMDNEEQEKAMEALWVTE